MCNDGGNKICLTGDCIVLGPIVLLLRHCEAQRQFVSLETFLFFRKYVDPLTKGLGFGTCFYNTCTCPLVNILTRVLIWKSETIGGPISGAPPYAFNDEFVS